ncbi:hypothetical protein BJ875DRAFT_491434 [Amylocarpus encephaloides]|uniref:Uncharacterized protein n=1 Tax=Amylocarpus encephaloides TaxID=45428 RepID=A0A9P7YTY3_9HELO|nr:hypothetical protein BJ875DRAFT_491434 [Amylocarpus encephaloides]
MTSSVDVLPASYFLLALDFSPVTIFLPAGFPSFCILLFFRSPSYTLKCDSSPCLLLLLPYPARWVQHFSAMPSREGKNSANCCTSRDPPSPDGDPPRPTVSPMKVPHQVTKDIVSSGSTGSTGATAELAELSPIFEEDKEPCSETTPASLTALLMSDKSENDEESTPVKPRKSTSTLSAVKQKLKKHLSRESNPVKRRSMSSVGTSEEEVERRAELRRIRHKRIQDELSNEASYDDDAKTLSSIADADTILGATIRTSWVPGDALPLPRVLSPSLSCTTFLIPEMPHLGEQSEMGETTVAQDNGSHIDIYQQDSTPKNKFRGFCRPNGTILRRHSSPILQEGEGSSFHQQADETQLDNTMLQMPLAPVLQPKRLPSIPEPPISSWRLSFTLQNRRERLWKLNQEHKAPTPKRLEEPASHPSLRRWLDGKGLRSTSNLTTNRQDCSTTESLPSNSNGSSDLRGVDGGVGRHLSTVHLHEMGIAQRLASRTLTASPSSPEFNGWGSHRRGDSSLSNASCFLNTERGKYLRATSESMALSEQIPRSWERIIPEKGSSLYSSTANSIILLSPESSRFNLTSILTGGKVKSVNEEGTEKEIPHSERGLSISTTASDCSPHHHPLTRLFRKPTFDDSSVVVSETDSFREREAELSVVKARFASAEAQRSPSTPVSSKFREEFDMEPERSDSPIVRRASKFAKLAKTFAIKTYDDQPVAESLDIHMPVFIPSEIEKSTIPAGEVLGSVWSGGLRKRSAAKRDRKASDEPKTNFGGLGLMKKKRKNKVEINDHEGAAEECLERFDEPTCYLRERKHQQYHYEGDEHPSHADDTRKKNIVKEVHRVIKEEIKKYENKDEDPEVEDTFGCRSGLNPPLKLDFPELKILLMEVRTAAHQEKGVIEQTGEANRLQKHSNANMGTVDGSMDEEAAGRSVSISDPKFYQDCLIHKSKKDAARSPSKKGKYRTWSGKDWDAYRSLSSSSFGSGYGSGGGDERRSV